MNNNQKNSSNSQWHRDGVLVKTFRLKSDPGLPKGLHYTKCIAVQSRMKKFVYIPGKQPGVYGGKTNVFTPSELKNMVVQGTPLPNIDEALMLPWSEGMPDTKTVGDTFYVKVGLNLDYRYSFLFFNPSTGAFELPKVQDKVGYRFYCKANGVDRRKTEWLKIRSELINDLTNTAVMKLPEQRPVIGNIWVTVDMSKDSVDEAIADDVAKEARYSDLLKDAVGMDYQTPRELADLVSGLSSSEVDNLYDHVNDQVNIVRRSDTTCFASFEDLPNLPDTVKRQIIGYVLNGVGDEDYEDKTLMMWDKTWERALPKMELFPTNGSFNSLSDIDPLMVKSESVGLVAQKV